MSVRSSVLALPATARSMPWAPLAGAAASVAALAVAQRPWDGRELNLAGGRVTLAMVAIGSGFALDDPAAVTLAPSPTSLLWRRGARLALATVAAATVAMSGMLVVAAIAGTGDLPLGRLTVEGGAFLLLAAALSVGFGGDRGVFAFAGALLGAIVVQQRWPRWSLFPMEPGSPGWSGSLAAWAAIAVVSAGALLVLSRDP